MFRKRNILKNQRGVAALEFALVAPLFFGFVLGIVDVCLYFAVAGQLQHAVVQAARQIRTGNVVGNTGASRDAFRVAVCDHIKIGLVNNCATNVRVDIRSFNSFGAISLPTSLDANSNGTIEDGETVFDTGGASCPVVVRAFFNYHTLVPGLQNLLAAVVPNSTYITAAVAFRNEPFTGGTSSSCVTAGDLN